MEIILLLLCMLIMLLIYFYAENQLLVIKKYTVTKSGSSSKKLKVVQISDVHKKRIAGKLAAKTKELEPDIILLTGDMVSRNETEFSTLEKMLCGLSQLCPVFACIGNHEQDLPDELMEQYRAIMKKYDVHLLENSRKAFEGEGISVELAGASLRHGVYKNPDGGYSGLEKYTADDLKKDVGERMGFTVLLAHNPLCIDAYSGWGADVVFSGHIHGGSVRLPYLGGFLSPERRFFPKYSKGVYKKGNTVMVVSGGIGKPRLFNLPEIVYCEIQI